MVKNYNFTFLSASFIWKQIQNFVLEDNIKYPSLNIT